MSIVINLIIIPQRIAPDKWKEVYKESLNLLRAYDFMDRFSAQRNGLTYHYAEKSRDVDNFLNTGYRGWRCIGDMRTGDNTEDYILLEDIRAYLPSEKIMDNGGDILFGVLDDMDVQDKPEGCVNIWGGRTEGEDSHIYLLAVGCLFASRFPEAVMVTGSISAGQCKRAVRWANQYLDTPVHIPDIGCMDSLLERLKKTSIPHEQIPEAFYQLTIEARTQKMGKFLQREFTDKEISSYYKNRLAEFSPGQRGFLSVLKEYLEMGYSFEELCRLVVIDGDGPKASPEEFITHIMNFRLHVKEKETGDFTRFAVWQEDSEKVDSLRQEIGRVLGMLCGMENRNVNAFYPLESIREDCKAVLGGQCDVDSVVDSFLENERNTAEAESGRVSLQALLYDLPDSIFRKGESGDRTCRKEQRYDVNAYKELINFVPGCSVKPELEKDLLKNFRAVRRYAGEEFMKFKNLNREERENYLISNNQRVLIRKNVWDRIFERVMDDTYIIRIFGIFGVNSERKEGYLFCRHMFAAPDALDYFWERTADEV